MAKGYFGAKSVRFRMANQAVMKSLNYAYIGRRLKKRDFRQLWIARINAATKAIENEAWSKYNAEYNAYQSYLRENGGYSRGGYYY